MEKKNIIEISVFAAVIIIATLIKEYPKYDFSKQEELRNSVSYYSSLASFDSYIYIDLIGVTHTSSTCKGIAKIITCSSVDTIRLDSVNNDMINKICSRCVTGDQLERMVEISNKNKSVKQ